MATTTASPQVDWRQEWFEFEDATYLNLAGQSPLPRVSIRAVQAALEAKKFPHHKTDATYFEVPNRIRENIARLLGGKPEVIVAKGEFPLQYTTWMPMEEREGVKVKIVAPKERFISADDLIAAITPRTRVVSVSLVRYDDGSLLDAPRVAAACHQQGALLLLDVSQCCGAISMDVRKLGADFLVCAGYKWLLSPYGTGFFWVKSEHLPTVRPGPFYWMAVQGADNFSALNFDDP